MSDYPDRIRVGTDVYGGLYVDPTGHAANVEYVRVDLYESGLRPCPCGSIPKELVIMQSTGDWHWIAGDCCSTWQIEAYAKPDEMAERFKSAWNRSPRTLLKREGKADE